MVRHRNTRSRGEEKDLKLKNLGRCISGDWGV